MISVSVESVAIHEALRVALRMAPPTSGVITLRVHEKKFQLLSYSELNQCQITIPATTKGEGEFGISVEALRDATRGREELEMAYKNTVLKITTKGYAAELATVDAIAIDAGAQEKASAKLKISKEQAHWLKGAVSAAALKPTAVISSYMPLGVQLTSKGAFVSCFDTNHMSFLSSKEITGDAKFVIPLDTMQGILDTLGATNFNIELGESHLQVSNKLTVIRVALPHVEEQGPSLDDVVGKAKVLAKSEGKLLVLPTDKFIAFLENSKAVAMKERGEVQLRSDNGKTSVSVTTVNGTVKAVLPGKGKGKIEFNIDYEYLDELVRKSGESVELMVIDQSLVLSKTPKVNLVVAFNQ